MDKKIFRSKSVDRISSPEQLNDYVRVSNPSIWMVLAAIIVLLVGVCVWGVFGKMDITVPVATCVANGKAVCFVKENDINSIKEGQTVRIKEEEYAIKEICDSPRQVSADTDAYVLHTGSLSVGEWVYEVSLEAKLPDGIYEGKIVIQSIRPMSFLLN